MRINAVRHVLRRNVVRHVIQPRFLYTAFRRLRRERMTTVVETVYGVVSDPLDIVHDGTHPLQTTSDFDWWGVLFGFLLMALFIGVLLAIAPSLVVALLKGVWWLICLP